jgi:leucyl/phenylalanyl-tRNA--protein transferase
MDLPYMRPELIPPRFPPPETADENGLLMVGGKLTPEWLIAAYGRGIFPMPIDRGMREVLGWFSPDPRGVIEFDDLHVSRRLAQKMNSGRFHYTLDRRFREVVDACAAPRHDEDGVWITAAMREGYLRLHQLGVAHSLEVWQGEQLAGGIFGIALGGFFAGESMFHHVTDASKAALAWLVEHLRSRGFRLFDVQWTNSHTESLGATEIPRRTYLRRLAHAVQLDVSFVAS